MPTQLPPASNMPFTMAMSAINASSIAPIAPTICNPFIAPVAAASIKLMYFSLASCSPCSGSAGVSVSGSMSLAINRPPGAAMKLAASRYSNGTPNATYPAMTDPAIEAMPPTITANNSERVIPGM